MTLFCGIQNTEQIAKVGGNAARRCHIFSLIPVLRCRQAQDCVNAEAFRGEGQIALSSAGVGVEREWSNDLMTKDVFGVNVQITS